jgi:hypothetical protein
VSLIVLQLFIHQDINFHLTIDDYIAKYLLSLPEIKEAMNRLISGNNNGNVWFISDYLKTAYDQQHA